MTLAEKVTLVEEIFKDLDEEISAFQKWSGLHCADGCGKCCFKPDINATILEFLPLAFHAYDGNYADELYEKVKVKEDDLCVILDPSRLNGMCSDYHHRGMICRIFGYSARMNKYGTPEMITCKIIKTEQEVNYTMAVGEISMRSKSIPIAENYYRKLMMIDDELGRTLYPINVAIKKALEEVMHYYAYREVRE